MLGNQSIQTGGVAVKFYSDIRGVVGLDSITVEIEENEMIDTLITRLCQRFPDSFLKVIYEPNTKRLNSAISILLNQLNIVLLEGVKTSLKNGDEVIFFAAVSGG